MLMPRSSEALSSRTRVRKLSGLDGQRMSQVQKAVKLCSPEKLSCKGEDSRCFPSSWRSIEQHMRKLIIQISFETKFGDRSYIC